MSRLRTLVYGLSHEHANGKLCALRKLRDRYDVVGVYDDRPAVGIYYADPQADPSDFPAVTREEALGLGDVDVVFVEVTNRELMDVAALFAERGVAMHCDKPCGESMEPFRTILGRYRERNVPMQIGYMYRGNPAVRFAWNAVESGWLGDIVFVEADMNHDYAREGYAEYISGFRGGLLYNLGCHLVDLAFPMARGRFLGATPFLGDAPGDFAGAKTRGAAMLRFEGTDVLIRTSSHMPCGIDGRRLRVDGTNGSLEIRPIERFDGRPLTLEIVLKNPAGGFSPGVHTVDFGVQDDRFAPQLMDLAEILSGEKPNDQDYERDLRVHELTLKACGL